MDKKIFLIMLVAVILLMLNFSSAQEIDNSTDCIKISNNSLNFNESLLESSVSDTHFDVESTTNFDVIGDYFKVQLSDTNNNSLKNTKVTFTVNGVSYTKNTDSSGIASLQLRLKDGMYNVVSKFNGNSKYKSCQLSTKITLDNTREVESGLSNSEIQNIINQAKTNNVILFKGSSYSNINLIITKSLTLQSNVNTILKSNSGSIITINGKNASLTKIIGFNIQNGDKGIVINNADYVTITKNEISTNGDAIQAIGSEYLNISNNNIVKNSNSGIILLDTTSTYIFNNNINNNGENAIGVTKSSKTYIHDNIIQGNAKNGILLTNKFNGKNYDEGPQNVYISNNNIVSNLLNGILIEKAEDTINIKSNYIGTNHENGISISKIGSNTIQSNVVTANWVNGIKFFDNYVKPINQDISYNALYNNLHMDVQAKDTYYQENGNRLQLGDNWYTDFAGICPKINSNNIKFTVSQTGPNQFQATFTDSQGNIASLLPDRTLTYTTNNGNSISITVKGGVATFTVDAEDGDLIKATVDNSQRDNIYDSNTISSKAVNGQTPTYSYPSIPNYQLYQDIGSKLAGDGTGDGSGDGVNGDANSGNSVSQYTGNSNGNTSYNQNVNPSNNINNHVNDVSQGYTSQNDVSQAGASRSGNSNQQQSVVKQIIIDEDDFYKVTGVSFIILLMILTVVFYYREDIKEINSKR